MRIYARMRQRFGELRLGVLVFGLIGAVFLTIGAVLMVYGFSFRKSAVKVPATIMEIEEYASRDSNGRRTTGHNVFVRYTVRGHTYDTLMDAYSSSWQTGDTITIYCDPENPESIQSGVGVILGAAFSAFGVGFLAVVVVVVRMGKQKHRPQNTQHTDMHARGRFRLKGLQFVGLIFGLIGIALFVVGAVFAADSVSFRKHAVEIPATITDIEQYYGTDIDGRRTIRHSVSVQYTMQDNVYETFIDAYFFRWQIGDTIPIYCDPENPKSIRSGVGVILGTVFASFGGVFVLVGLAMLIRQGKRSRQDRRLMTYGQVESVPITEILLVDNVWINHRRPYRIVCRWQSPSGDRIAFQSRNLLEDPTDTLERAGITEMTVYMDALNPRKYTMDHSVLEELCIPIV